MIILNPEKARDKVTPRVDTDLVFIDISNKLTKEEYNEALECITMAIISRSVMQFGKPPEEF